MVSFDVFDTLITRKTYTPKGIFYLVQNRIKQKCFDLNLKEDFVENFVIYRINAEKLARSIKDIRNEDLMIDEIYSVMSKMTGYTDKIIQFIKETEIQLEIECACPIVSNVNILLSYLEIGERVVLISDSYLPSEVIKTMLSKASDKLLDIPIYISGECGYQKRAGGLYAWVRKKEEIVEEWVHYGDNEQTDINGAEYIGIIGRQLRIPELPMQMHIASLGTSLYLELFLGTIRCIVLSSNLSTEEFLGMFWGGGLLYTYVSWIIEISLLKGVSKLFFVARDGHILKHIAEIIIKKKELDIKAEYIYGSRTAWRTEDENQKGLIRKYFASLGWEPNCSAIVDLCGSGKSVINISGIISDTCKVNVFYYHLWNCPNIDSCNFYIYSNECVNGILECFARAPHGYTVGYRIYDGKVLPVMEDDEDFSGYKMKMEKYESGVQHFSEMYSDMLSDNNLDGISHELSDSLMRILDGDIPVETLDYIGNMPHHSKLCDSHMCYAPKLTRDDIYNIYMYRTIEKLSYYYKGSSLLLSEKRMETDEIDYMMQLKAAYFTEKGNKMHEQKHSKQKSSMYSGKTYIVYGAGEIGKRIYMYLRLITSVKDVYWTDLNWKRLSKFGYPIECIGILLKKTYDCIVITIEDEAVNLQIRKNLINLGCDKHKIINYRKLLLEVE